MPLQDAAAPVAQTPVTVAPNATPAEIYRALQTSRRLVRDQLTTAESDRAEVARQLRQPGVAADRDGLEQQLRVLDIRIQDLRQQLAEVETREAVAAAVPGSTKRTPDQLAAARTEAIVVGTTLVTLAIVFPLAIAYARRLWKRHAVSVTLSPQLEARLDSIDRAVEATAIEVERIGEGQRFVTQLLAQQREPLREGLPRPTAPER